MLALVFLAAPAAHAVTLSNAGAIPITDAAVDETPGEGVPYPSTIAVAGVTGSVNVVGVTLHGFTHECPSDLDMLLVGPHGQDSILMSDAGDCTGTDRDPIELSFQDSSTPVPCLGSGEGTLQPGAYAPTDRSPDDTDACNAIGPDPGDVFDAPAPPGPWPTGLATFNGVDPNGTWQLFVMDQYNGDVGSIEGGWSLALGITPPQLASAPSVSGAPEVSKPLTAKSGTIVGGGGPAYQWFKCAATSCSAIPGATSGTYTPVTGDRGRTIEVGERAVNSGGQTVLLTSPPTSPVGPPSLSSRSKGTQRVLRQKGVIVKALSNIGGTLNATGTVAVPKSAKVVRLKSVKKTLTPKRRATVKLGLSKAAQKAIAKALHRGAKLKAKIRLVVSDANGAKTTTTKTVKLKA